MIAGIGVDLCRIARLEKSLARPAFWAHVFGEEERAFLEALGPRKRAESAAANFAAKEAFLKAVGLGIGGLPLGQIQALRHPDGSPFFLLGGQAAALAEQRGLKASLSLTHEGEMALAFVVLEQAD